MGTCSCLGPGGFLGRTPHYFHVKVVDVFRIQLLLVQHWINVASVYGGFLGFDCRKLESPQLQFFMVVVISCRGAEADSQGLAVQQTTDIPPLQFIDKVFDVTVGQVQQIPRVRSVRRQSRSHSCTCLIRAWTRSFTRPLCAMTDACGSDCFKTADSRSCSSSRSSSSPCCGAEADSHRPCDHGDSPVAFRYGGQFPLLQVVLFPVVTQRLVPWSRLFLGPQGFPSSS